MKRNIIISALLLIASICAGSVHADHFDEALILIEKINKIDMTTISRPMAQRMDLPFSTYNLDVIKSKMTSMTIVNAEENVSKVRNILQNAISLSRSDYQTILGQKDEDGETTKILARTDGDDFSRLAFIIDDIDEISFVTIDGKFTEADISSLMNKRRSRTNGSVTINGHTLKYWSEMDTTNMTESQKKAIRNATVNSYNQYKSSIVQYQRGIEQYQRGIEQYQRGIEQYKKSMLRHQEEILRLRKRLKEMGIATSSDSIPFTSTPKK